MSMGRPNFPSRAILCLSELSWQGIRLRPNRRCISLCPNHVVPCSNVSFNGMDKRHGNLREEEKRGFMRAITVQDFNPALRIFVQAPTQEMRQRLVKVREHLSQVLASKLDARYFAAVCSPTGEN